MEKIILCLFISAAFISPVYLQGIEKDLKYGNDSEQIMDIYLPNNTVTKVILMIHGGAWYKGSRNDMQKYIDKYRPNLPEYAIANMDHRLARNLSPGFPKQIMDIDLAIKFLKQRFSNDINFALVGLSSGAHLSMLYGYGFDRRREVKAIVDIIGRADLTDKDISNNLVYNLIITNLVGPYFYIQNPDIYHFTSPTSWIDASSPKTISFYGDSDPRVPKSQGPILKKKLDQANVTNEFYLYPGGHGNWTEQYQNDMFNKTFAFFNKYF